MKMKLKGTILLCVIIPLISVTAISAVVSAIQANSLAQDELEQSMLCTAQAFDEALKQHEGRFDVDGNGNVYKGDYNLSQDTSIVDAISERGCEATFFWGDTRVMTSIRDDAGNRVIGTKTTDSNVLTKVLQNGETYFSPSLTINGQNYYVVYMPVYQEGSSDIVGMAFIGKLSSGVTSSVMKTVLIIGLLILLTAAVSIVIVVLKVNGIVKAVRETEKVASSMAEGNMTVSITEKALKRHDEIGDICRAMDKLKSSLTSVLKRIVESSNGIVTTASALDAMADETSQAISQVESAVNDIATGATSQADDTTRASNNVVEMGELINQTVGVASQLKTNAEKMNESGVEAASTLGELKSINDRAIKAIDVIYEQTNITNESALKIRAATNIITSIASETNLLSLNASIEAARAGEQGRGFAVVADQIQKLAEQSNASGVEIETIVNSLIEDSNKSVQTMNEVKEIMLDQTNRVAKTEEAFEVVRNGIASSLDSVNAINNKSQALNNARVSVVDIIQNLTAIAEENAASTEETSAAAVEVSASVDNVAKSAGKLKDVTLELEASTKQFQF